MSTPAIDYDALAKQNGAIQPPVDYDALAKQHGAIETTSTGIAAPQGTEGTGHTGRDLLTGISEGAANTTGNLVSGTARLLHKIPYVGETLAPEVGIRALEQRTQDVSTPQNTAQQVGRTAEQIGEWMIPTGAEEKAGALAAEHLPQIAKVAAPVAKLITGAGEAGARNVSQGGEFGTGAAIGAAGTGLGIAGKAIAPKVAESALGVTNRMRGHGRTIGEAALNEVSGVRPATIARQSGGKLGQMTADLEARAEAAGQTGVTSSIKPALDVIDEAVKKAQARNSGPVLDKLNTLRSQLTTEIATGNPIPEAVAPRKILDLKRGIGDLIGSWSVEEKKGIQKVLPSVYRVLDSELDAAVPGAKELNQRISSLIPVNQRAEKIGNLAPTAQRIAHRMAAHTGALAAAGIGGGLGYQHGGIPGAVLGGSLGIALPELAVSPAIQMSGARVLQSPVAPALAKGVAAQFTPRSEEEEVEKTRKKK